MSELLSTPATKDWSGLRALHKRISAHATVTELAFILGRRRRYSQSTSGFPNIYFVRASLQRTSFGASYVPSLWLKRLILEYVASEQKRIGSNHQTQPVVSPDAILTVFCGQVHQNDNTGDQLDGYYPLRLTKDCLGELAREDDIGLLRASRGVSRAGQLYVDSVALTPRADYCLSECFDHFAYLQLVVDDPDLWVPKSLAGVLDYDGDYSYLVDVRSYAQNVATVVQRKLDQVWSFTGMLSVALQKERATYAKAFENLDSLGVAPLPIDRVRDHVYSHALAVQSAAAGKFSIPGREQLDKLWQTRERAVEDDLAAAMGRTR